MRCELKKVITRSPLRRKVWPVRETVCTAVKEEAARRSNDGEMGKLDAVNLLCNKGGTRCPKEVGIEQATDVRTHLGQGGLT